MKLLGFELNKRSDGVYLRRLPKPSRTMARSGFTAAMPSDMLSTWTTSGYPINAHLKRWLPALQARCREQGMNNPHANKFFKLATGNIIGPNGIILQSRVVNRDGTADKFASQAVEAAWKEWCHEENCSMSGTLDFIGIQNNFIHGLAEDGEAIWMKVQGKAAGDWRFALHRIDPGLLDIALNEPERNGIRIVMGVEMNRWNRPIAYHLKKGDDDTYDGTNPWSTRHQRVPAELIYHGFLRERPNQVRGVPWLAPPLLRMKILDAYVESALHNARHGANKFGFITTKDGEGLPETISPLTGEQVMDASIGSWFNLAEGQAVEGWKPDYPHQQFPDFVKAALESIGAGLNLYYPSISGNIQGVNLSALRGFLREERDYWKAMQGFASRGFLRWVFHGFLPVALAQKRIVVKGNPLSLEYEDKYLRHQWQGRRWDHTEPLKDVQAHTISREQLFKSRSMIIREMGYDPEEVFEDIAREEALLKDMNLTAPTLKPVAVMEDEDAEQGKNPQGAA